MENATSVKLGLIGILGLVGGKIAEALGGWDTALGTLIIFMGIDFITGLLVAGVFQQSEKTSTGALESRAGWKGLCRKGMTLFIVLIATRLDMTIGADYIRNAVIIAYIANETISIIENAALMGVPIPEPIKKGIDILQSKTETDDQGA